MSAPNTQQTVNTVQLNVPADGLQIGGSSASTTLIGFYGATPVAQPVSYATLTDSSGGTAAATNGILTLTGSYNSTILANALATLAAAVNGINAAGVSLGVWAY